MRERAEGLGEGGRGDVERRWKEEVEQQQQQSEAAMDGLERQWNMWRKLASWEEALSRCWPLSLSGWVGLTSHGRKIDGPSS